MDCNEALSKLKLAFRPSTVDLQASKSDRDAITLARPDKQKIVDIESTASSLRPDLTFEDMT